MNFEETILQITREKLGAEASAIERAPKGQISDTFFFQANGTDYVIRLSRAGLGNMLHKERYVVESLLSNDIPVARFVCIDEFDDRTFAITQRIPGVTSDTVGPDALNHLMPSLMVTLDRIHRTDISHTTGFGDFKQTGEGRCKTWQERLLSVGDTRAREDGGFYGDWTHLFDDTFLERDLFDDIYAELKTLAPRCPNGRWLVHGDYGFDNIIVNEGKLVAVLDWANAMFGDFLFDVAWLSVFMEGRDVATEFKELYAREKREVPDMDLRLRCYYCFMGLDAMRFYAATNQQDAYEWAKRRLAERRE